MSITQIFCKDCGAVFHYADHAATSDRMAGRSVPERCSTCRNLHRREYSTLGVSHSDVLQLRTDGHGGLSSYIRNRKPSVKMATQKSDRDPLPIEAIIDELIDKLLNSKKKVHLVVGPTGSGKSTWMPLQLVCCADLIRKGSICVTQPRIPATVGPSSYIGFLYYGADVKPSVGQGLIVGYRHSQVGTTMTDAANRLIFMTDGTLLNEVKNNDLKKYCIVMIDEAHERSVNIDTIMALLKEKLPIFTELRVIIASATVDADKFINYFGGNDHVEAYYSKGFTYPILEMFSDETLAHWPGGHLPMEGTPNTIRWEELEKEIVDSKWLGPSPCFNFKPYADKYKFRYYPQFEALVFQGIMTDGEKAVFMNQSNEDAWQTAITSLYEESRREIKISDTQTVTIDKSIRGALPRQTKPELYKQVSPDLKDRLIYGAVDTICRLVRRDEIEAKRRLERWKKRSEYGWDKLEPPHPVGHILAFFPTGATQDRCADLLEKQLSTLPGNNQIFVYRSTLSEDEKQKVMAKTSAESMIRKIILGTNLAETSLTVEDLFYVVDTGLILQTFYNPVVKGVDYPTILHSHAGCRQRLGRVGRKEPGEGYRIYTREEFKAHPAYTTPEVTRSDPAQLILNLVSAGLPPSFIHKPGALMQPPNKAWIDDKLTDLQRMDAIDEDGDLTSRGVELTQIREKNLWNAVLLCEADRFGCLWEMAVFLCFIGLNDRKGPDKQSKWLALWVPDDRKVYEDDLEEKLEDLLDETMLEESDAEESSTSTASSNRIWDNPYARGSALIKQQALRWGCLDDLELFLRIWQGWSGQGDNPEKRNAWAAEHGISAEALMRVERALGLDPKDTSGTGMLRHFWAFDQKGILKRDIHFESLDKVRYLYAAANHENHFFISPDGDISPCNPNEPRPDPRKPLEIKFEPESVWNNQEINQPMRFDKSAKSGHLVATVKIKPRKKKTIKTLRHVVWLDADWVKNGMPSLYDNPVHLARTFSTFSDTHLIHYGKWPFARGTQLSSLPWPMPHLPVPSPLEIQQWQVRYNHGMTARMQYPAVLVHCITWPEGIKAMGFVQLISGPLLPMALDKDKPVIGERIKVFLKYDESHGYLWAVLPKTKTISSVTSSQAENKYTSPSTDIAGDTRVQEDSKANASSPVKVPLRATTTTAAARVVPMPRPKPVDLQKQLPTNSVIIAEFIKYAPQNDKAWITVSIAISDKQKKEWGFPVYKEINMNRFKDMSSGKKCRVRIKKWITKKEEIIPLLNFIEWIS